jgi:hypothetical protein
MSQRIARDWQTSPRLIAALEKSSGESLGTALRVGELLGGLALLESQRVITGDEGLATLRSAGLRTGLLDDVWARLAGAGLAGPGT